MGYAQRLGPVPGVVKISREGSTDDPMDIRLTFDGTAINGEDYVQVEPLISFNAGEQTKLLNIMPAFYDLDKSQPKLAVVSLLPDTTSYALYNPWSASVLILDQFDDAIKDYTSWQDIYFPDAGSDLSNVDSESDTIVNLREYAQGLDPTVVNNIGETHIDGFSLNERLVLQLPSASGLSDIRLYPQGSSNGTDFVDVSDQFDHDFYALSDSRVMHEFTSRFSLSAFETGLYRLVIEQIPALNQVADASELLGALDTSSFFATGDSVWTPSASNAWLAASARESGETSSIKTAVTGPVNISFEWNIDPLSNATLRFNVNGIEKTSVAVTSGWQLIEVNETEAGVIPTLNEWGIIVLMTLLAGAAAWKMNKPELLQA